MDVGDLGVLGVLGVLAIINQGLPAQLMVEARIGFGILRKTKECRPGSRWASTNGRRGSRLGCWLSFQHERARRGIFGLPWCWLASLLICNPGERVEAGLPIAPSSRCWRCCGAAVLLWCAALRCAVRC